MKMSQLLNNLNTTPSAEVAISDIHIQGVADNSLNVKSGYVFVAIEGFNSNGHHFINHAIEKGASLVVGEQEVTGLSVPYIQVENSRKALGIISRNFYGHPSKDKVVIGITGTNGKTTTSYMLKHLLESNGKTCSIFGTIQNIINGEKIKSSNTTPSALALHKLLALSKDEIVIMEVSSHALTQHRIEGIDFDYCLFTNLENEHLDYHKTMENYFETKLSLFHHLKPDGKAVVNTDNNWGKKLAEILRGNGRSVYAIGEAQESDLRILKFKPRAFMILVEENKEITTLHSPMGGIHNMYNLLMAYGTSILLNIDQKGLLRSTHHFHGVEGRFEIFKQSNGATIVVDYAHTPDAISHCLTTAKQQGAKRITHIFGFRGDRDTSKREAMLSATVELSDHYILTFDDLNSVSAEEMLATLNRLNETCGNSKGSIIPDRTFAIKQAISESEMGDWIVVTGKGHEKYQQQFQLPTTSDRETVDYLINTK